MKKPTKIQTVKNLFGIGVMSLIFLFPSCKKDDNNPTPTLKAPATVVDVVTADTSFSLLAAAATKANLITALQGSNLTVFAPNNTAFRKAGFPTVASINSADVNVLTAILKYHVLGTAVKAADLAATGNTKAATLGGDTLFVTKSALKINGSKSGIIKTDVTTTNGSVVHVIDNVLIPPTGDIINVATGTTYGPVFTVLAYALTKASLISALQNTGAFTVFAPTNAAFYSFLGVSNDTDAKAKIDALDPATLKKVLLYHVLPTRVFSSNLSEGLTAKTLQGGSVAITLAGGAGVKGASNANSSKINPADVLAKNGVIHAIDSVLKP